MTENDIDLAGLRTGLIESLQHSRAAERDLFAAIDPAGRETPAADGGWSAKDTLAHLSAWRQRQADRLAARREGRADPPMPATEIDDINAIFHAERADWTWDRVAADAEATAERLVAEVTAAGDETLGDPKVVGSIMADGAEHDLGHLAGLAPTATLRERVLDLASTTRAVIDRGGWPPRSAAYARYNLACFYVFSGHLDEARSLLRQALPEQGDLQALAPKDDDLLALRYEIPALAAG
jgi:hypothetical protein